ncbi:MAG: OmpA family protein [Acidobacteria bacterium]|nr:OmpA family protein [Acidobacteriota bacterium]
MARRKKEEEPENHERWLVSYADFITLLFAFFTTLYAISTVDAHKMGQMVLSMQKSFDAGMFASGSSFLSLDEGPSGNGDTLSSDILNKIKLQEGFEIREAIMTKSGTAGNVISGKKDMRRLKNSIDSLLSSSKLKASVSLKMDSRGLVLSLGEGGFFDSGSEIIKPEGRILLDTLATSLIDLGNDIRIEGHADTDPIKTSKFASNWDLSTARATEILRYMIEKFGFQPGLLSAAGYGEFRPVAPNDTLEGKARNRRVDIVILDPMEAKTEPRGILDTAQNSQ